VVWSVRVYSNLATSLMISTRLLLNKYKTFVLIYSNINTSGN
jgi:hypothetical protein